MNYRNCRFGIVTIVVGALFLAGTSLYAHQPHDKIMAAAISPDFGQDGIGFASAAGGRPPHDQQLLRTDNGGLLLKRVVNGLDLQQDITYFAVSPDFTVDGTVFATTSRSGVYLSQDKGLSWRRTSADPSNLDLDAAACSIDADSQLVLLVAGRKGGLYRSADLGSTWTTVIGGATLLESIAFSPEFGQDGEVIVGDGSGSLLLSTDRGISWIATSTLPGAGAVLTGVLAPGFSAGGDAFFGTESGGLFRTTDGGVSYSPINACLPGQPVTALALSPEYATDSVVFLGTNLDGVYKSTDKGGCFTRFNAGLTLSDNVDVHFETILVSDNFAQDQTVLLGMYEGLMRSTDGGESWFPAEVIPQSTILGFDLSPAFPQDNTFAVARYGSGASITRNAAALWAPANLGILNPYMYDIAFSSNFDIDKTLFSVHASHALRSTDRAVNWDLSAKLEVGSFPNIIAVSPTFATDATVFSGSRADGLFRSTNGGVDWSRVFFDSDRRFDSLAISPQFVVDGTVFASRDTRGVVRSQDGGDTWEIVNDGLPLDRDRGPLLSISPEFATDQTIVAGTLQGLYQSLDGGDSWSLVQITDLASDAPIETVAISPAFGTDSIILASPRGKGLYRSTNGGASWAEVGGELIVSNYQIQTLRFSSGFATDGTVFAISDANIFRSDDGGITFSAVDLGLIRHENTKPKQQWNVWEGSWQELSFSQASANSIHFAADPGSAAVFYFNGTGVRWLGAKVPQLGIAEVFIDGVSQGTVDQYAANALPRRGMFLITDLEDGFHQLKVVATDQKNPNSTGFGLVVDAFEVLLPAERP